MTKRGSGRQGKWGRDAGGRKLEVQSSKFENGGGTAGERSHPAEALAARGPGVEAPDSSGEPPARSVLLPGGLDAPPTFLV